jgi:hypothetical protein
MLEIRSIVSSTIPLSSWYRNFTVFSKIDVH